MATYSKQKLTGSTYGKGILISETSSASPNLLHSAVSSATDFDELWLWAYSDHTDTQPVNLTIEFGLTNPTKMTMAVESKKGLYLICPGLPVQFSVQIRAYAEIADKITIYGYVNRISH